jgi:hypothetical protein
MKTISTAMALTAILFGLANAAPAAAEPAPAGSAIVCPSVLLAGRPATVSIVHQGKPASGVTVETDGGAATTDGSGRCTVNVPGEAKAFNIKLQRSDSTVVVKPTVSPAPATSGLSVTEVFDSIQPNHYVTIFGAGFSGTPDGNVVEFTQAKPDSPKESVTVKGSVIACSPNQLVVSVPELATGKTTLTVKAEGAQTEPRELDVVNVSFHLPKATLAKGSREKMDVIVEGTDKATVVRIINRTPQIVKLLPSADFCISTSGGKRNKAVFPILVQEDGEYDVQASLVSIGGKRYKELPIANTKL